MVPGDDEIARRIQRGEPGAFDAFFDRFAGPLHGYLAGMVGDDATAEDLVQETMLRVFRNSGRYEERGTFRAWVFRIASNLALTELRRRRYRAAVPLAGEGLEVADGACRDPGEVRAEARRAEAVEAALAALPDEQRAVIVLRVRQEMRLEEIARTLCVPEGTVKSRLHHAVRRLRELVGRMDEPRDEEERHASVR